MYYSEWKATAYVANNTGNETYPKTCHDECVSNCSASTAGGTEYKCFGKVHYTAVKQNNATTMAVPCECAQSTVKRYPGRYCGPQRQACHRINNGKVDPGTTFKGLWVDGFNTFYHNKSKINV